MAEGTSAAAMATSAYRTSVGRPKRFSQSWNSVMKRIYVTEEVLLEFRDLKNSGGFASDDLTLRYLLSHHRLQVQECLDMPIASNFTPTRESASAPSLVPMCSTPSSGRAATRELDSSFNYSTM